MPIEIVGLDELQHEWARARALRRLDARREGMTRSSRGALAGAWWGPYEPGAGRLRTLYLEGFNDGLAAATAPPAATTAAAGAWALAPRGWRY